MPRKMVCRCHSKMKKLDRPEIKKFARRLYQNMTDSEKKFRIILDDILGEIPLYYCPQHIYNAGNKKYYILDYYFNDLELAIEIDGGIHEKQESYDVKRDVILANSNIVTARIMNGEVNKESISDLTFQIICESIKRRFKNKKHCKENRIKNLVETLFNSLYQGARVVDIKDRFKTVLSNEYKKTIAEEAELIRYKTLLNMVVTKNRPGTIKHKK